MIEESGRVAAPSRRYFLSTLGCPKNEVDSAKLAGRLEAAGYGEAAEVEEADLVVVNTCAFIEAAREESIETILALSEARRPGARLAVTGCLAARSGSELKQALPEIDVVAGFGQEVSHAPVTFRGRAELPAFDLLELPRPPVEAPWAYVKVAEGCDRRCGFCAIPSFRGPQRSRRLESILTEVESLQASEIVLVAQDLASYGRDGGAERREGEEIVHLLEEVSALTRWVRLLYLYPSSLDDRLIDAICATEVPYFDLSLQHVSRALLRRMRRFGGAEKVLGRIRRIRSLEPMAALRSSFIVGYPGETEEDHDALLAFLEEAELDWAGFFTFSEEEGTYAAGFPAELKVSRALAEARRDECAELQDAITAKKRTDLVGSTATVLACGGGEARSFREAPEIDGVIRLEEKGAPASLGSFCEARIIRAEGPDLVGEVIG